LLGLYKLAPVIFGEGEAELFLGVHYNGTTPGYRFAQGLTSYQKEFCSGARAGRSFDIFRGISRQMTELIGF